MVAYTKLDRFYDAAMGDRTEMASYIPRLIRRHKPRARTLLELACGTGAILKIRGPGKATGSVRVEAKTRIEPKDVDVLAATLRPTTDRPA